MDLRIIVFTADTGLAEVLRAQIENLGASCTIAETYEEASSSLDWADAAVIDLVGDGFDSLNRLRVEAPRLRVLAVATDDISAAQARTAGADQTLVEPFAISDVVEAVRHLGPVGMSGEVIDLRTGQPTSSRKADAPWWATT